MYLYVGVYTQRSGYWAEGNLIKTENRYRFHKRSEIMTTARKICYTIWRSR